MVELKVDNGKVETKMISNPSVPLYEELGQGIIQLLVDFQVEAAKRGNSVIQVRKAYKEMMEVIDKNAKAIAYEKISEL